MGLSNWMDGNFELFVYMTQNYDCAILILTTQHAKLETFDSINSDSDKMVHYQPITFGAYLFVGFYNTFAQAKESLCYTPCVIVTCKGELMLYPLCRSHMQRRAYAIPLVSLSEYVLVLACALGLGSS